MLLVPYLALKVALSQLVIELQALGIVGTSYKLAPAGEKKRGKLMLSPSLVSSPILSSSIFNYTSKIECTPYPNALRSRYQKTKGVLSQEG